MWKYITKSNGNIEQKCTKQYRRTKVTHLIAIYKTRFGLINESYSGQGKIQIANEKNIFLSIQMALNLPWEKNVVTAKVNESFSDPSHWLTTIKQGYK